MTLSSRLATIEDLSTLQPLVETAIDVLQQGFLSGEQIRASHAIMGIDSQLVADGTYYVIEIDGQVAGCGGWSRRSTLYGSDSSDGRDASLLDPVRDAARIRAMYTHPDHVRRGVGRLILHLCEDAARAEGFTRLQLMATMSGRPLYEAAGFVAVDDVTETVADVVIPLTRMVKEIGKVSASSGLRPAGLVT